MYTKNNEKRDAAHVAKMWKDDSPILFSLRAREIWTIRCWINLARRHPVLSQEQKDHAQHIESELDKMMMKSHPELASMLEEVKPDDFNTHKDAIIHMWKDENSILWFLLPREAWMVVSWIQLACRHPDINQAQENQAHNLADQIAHPLTKLFPSIGPILDKGWNPDFDVSQEDQ